MHEVRQQRRSGGGGRFGAAIAGVRAERSRKVDNSSENYVMFEQGRRTLGAGDVHNREKSMRLAKGIQEPVHSACTAGQQNMSTNIQSSQR